MLYNNVAWNKKDEDCNSLHVVWVTIPKIFHKWVFKIRTPPYYNKCALVHNQPNTSLRPTHPVRPLRSARLYPQTSISTGSPFQPPRGTFTPHSTHQETEKTLDIRWDKLRCGQWTNTWSNNTTNSVLAYRELCTVFSDCYYSIII